MATEKSGAHITGADSGWPVGDGSVEPPYTKDGDGNDVVGHDVVGVADGVITDASSANEVQTVTVTGSPAGGTFTLTFGGQTTAPIAYNTTAANLQSKLEALSSIGAGNVLVTGTAPGPFTVTFVGALGDTDVAQMTKDNAGLTGGTSPNVTVATGTPGSP